ncbi:PLDc N-terminal domain-containing protein [Alicyclobacillus cycloheptanicus]|uniref:Phosphatidylserine/phosphatidylglycerophosphate/ cardiolipin synthase-like enzyme n=1 Tax=Alicyclobacillus cycloheptanicus TaxID=1457 RepID=A0ABT9XIL2_9BACL|nr:phospholipase D-like domain-containing protein [Alicyclobacillus cycloheptanicus]MDQ0190125.1 phosphatidylserine/phosphatidylglycerophosphate/cardiolipin synthase-like enzyme [Alicyclobacillus cycloheptanicus]WDM02097.1 PLDc N-terminal domain-containing protein [Alicyclobacillus cycloheptanicus]
MAWIVLTCLYGINTLAVLAIAIANVHRPMHALTWVMIGVVLPLVGPILYLLLNRPLPMDRTSRPRARSSNSLGSLGAGSASGSLDGGVPSVALAVERRTGCPAKPGDVQVLVNGRPTYAALFKALQAAERSIDVEYYIYRDDAIGRQMTEILKERAAAGVRVRFMVDGMGSRKFPRAELRRMQASGIDCRIFFPLRFPWLRPTLNHRDHCKIVVVDGAQSFVGGINVGYEYTGLKPGVGWWRDTHLKLTGACVPDIMAVFERNWSIATPVHARGAIRQRPQPASSERGAAARPARLAGVRWAGGSGVSAAAAWGLDGEWSEELATDPSSRPVEPQEKLMVSRHALVQTIDSRPSSHVQTAHDVFFLCVSTAANTVDVTTPYFVPSPAITHALKTAVARGVRVRLLVPASPDHKMIGLASHTYFGDLLDAGVEIYQYQKGLLHTKVMTVDGQIAFVGAANMDLRSFRLNFEVGELLYSEAIASDLTSQFETDLQDARRLTQAMLAERPWFGRVTDRCARLLAPLL